MKVYRVFAYLVAAGVAFQAATIAYAFFALGSWVEKGGVLDKAAIEGNSGTIGGEGALNLHGTGGMVIGLLGLVFLVVSFFAKVPGGVKWAGITFGLIVLQIALGILSHAVNGLGALHGINALAIVAVAFMAGMRAGRAVRSRDAVVAQVVAPV